MGTSARRTVRETSSVVLRNAEAANVLEGVCRQLDDLQEQSVEPGALGEVRQKDGVASGEVEVGDGGRAVLADAEVDGHCQAKREKR